MLVDCDIHLGYDALDDLVPYLDAPTREPVVHSGSHGLSMPSYPWNHPTGWIRRDVYADDDGGVGSDFVVGLSLDTLRDRHLDRYGIDIGIVEPDSGVVATPIHVDEGQLTTGEADSVVRCPWHKWEFEIASGRCVVDDRLRVRRYTVREDGDGVVVSLDAPS